MDIVDWRKKIDAIDPQIVDLLNQRAAAAKEIGRVKRNLDMPIREGEILLLPAGVPHSPQRGADTVGLVVERQRGPGELDGFQWYCENCGQRLHEEFLQLTDIETQMPPLFERFYADANKRTCTHCGTVMERKS